MPPLPVIIDADTANEVDDLFAIVGAVRAPEFEVLALGSAQWQVAHWAVPETLEASQRLNEVLLSLLGRLDIPHPRGAARRVYDFGDQRWQDSTAARTIIAEASARGPENRVTVLGLGALTNVASALMIHPEIVSGMSLALLGTSYDEATGIWRKRDFNCSMDIHAIDEVLDVADLPTLILPVNVAARFTFGWDETRAGLPAGPVSEFLMHHWYGHLDRGRDLRVLWDLALVEILLDPSAARIETVAGPPENGSRPIQVVLDFDSDRLKANFFARLAANHKPS
ncbi:MAG: nucleoside hydrolase [Fimbriimonadaceae bacterium]|nr:nucleoside hydrolase [Fimbriimonadaceae bacterium]